LETVRSRREYGEIRTGLTGFAGAQRPDSRVRQRRSEYWRMRYVFYLNILTVNDIKYIIVESGGGL
jgi:tRNA U54 and U55 pseudouridine synthase Pus10